MSFTPPPGRRRHCVRCDVEWLGPDDPCWACGNEGEIIESSKGSTVPYGGAAHGHFEHDADWHARMHVVIGDEGEAGCPCQRVAA